MNILKVVFTIYFCLALTACSNSSEYQRSQLDIVSDKVIAETGRKVCEKYHLQMVGMGGGAPDGKIWSLGAWFSRRGKKLNLEESRELIVNVVQDYLDAINKEEELRPFLRDYPFTAKNLGIMIINFDEKGREVYDPDIGGMYANEGRISYHSNDPDDKYKYKFELREKYDEALSIIKHQQEHVRRR